MPPPVEDNSGLNTACSLVWLGCEVVAAWFVGGVPVSLCVLAPLGFADRFRVELVIFLGHP